MKKYCTCCGKQVVDAIVSINEPYMTILKNSVCDFNGLICAYCSNDLDENGMFPEEYRFLTNEELLDIYYKLG